MNLYPQDAKLFYQLFLPLLEYTNQRYNVNPLKHIVNNDCLNPMQVKEIANVLWDHVELIDDYLEIQASSLTLEEINILKSWKHCLKGTYILERHLKKGSIFISSTNEVYQVKGIISSWEQMLGYRPCPMILEATLIPFKDTIISDGLVIPMPYHLGKNIKQNYKDIYMSAKKENRIHTEL